jgi:hypothetical protein
MSYELLIARVYDGGVKLEILCLYWYFILKKNVMINIICNNIFEVCSFGASSFGLRTSSFSNNVVNGQSHGRCNSIGSSKLLPSNYFVVLSKSAICSTSRFVLRASSFFALKSQIIRDFYSIANGQLLPSSIFQLPTQR